MSYWERLLGTPLTPEEHAEFISELALDALVADQMDSVFLAIRYEPRAKPRHNV